MVCCCAPCLIHPNVIFLTYASSNAGFLQAVVSKADGNDRLLLTYTAAALALLPQLQREKNKAFQGGTYVATCTITGTLRHWVEVLFYPLLASDRPLLVAQHATVSAAHALHCCQAGHLA